MNTGVQGHCASLSQARNLGWSAFAGYEEVLRMEANRDGVLSKEEIQHVLASGLKSLDDTGRAL